MQEPLTADRLRQAYKDSHQELASSADNALARTKYVSPLTTPVEPLTADRLQLAHKESHLDLARGLAGGPGWRANQANRLATSTGPLTTERLQQAHKESHKELG